MSDRARSIPRMTKRAMSLSSRALTPDSTIATLAKHSIIDALTGQQLVVYIKLLGAKKDQGRRVHVLNSQLCNDARTAVRALRELENMGLIKISYDDGSRLGRTIEVP